MERVRLNKFLAQCGVCSRRQADEWIRQGRVSINGAPAAVGMSVGGEDLVVADGKRLDMANLAGPAKTLVYAYYKPAGVVCTERDRHAGQTIFDQVHTPVRVTYAGRLDKDSEGLLLLTNDGALIDAMMRGANRHEKEYVVQVDHAVTESFVKGMQKGVFLKELGVTTRPCRVRQTGEDTFRIVLTQGLNRQIRRMCETFGYRVIYLKRERVVNIRLGELKPGEYRELGDGEIAGLRACIESGAGAKTGSAKARRSAGADGKHRQ